ncbi:MAG: transposase [Spirochaetales bacterium]|nr:transposase [Spirochaetales bacterium]
MAFIKVQKLVLSEDGNVVSGSAAVVDTVYDSSVKGRSRHRVRERLGKVISISDDRKCGIFLSPTRGLVEYDSAKDLFAEVGRDDRRIAGLELFPEPETHTVFGDSYLILSFMEKTGITALLRSVFTKDEDFQRVLAHICHTVAKDGSHISCDDFVSRSFLSYVVPDVPLHSLYSDTKYFSDLGRDSMKVSLMKGYVEMERSGNKDFGSGCYVDSTPLPNDIDIPISALCSHGTGGCEMQARLAVCLDSASGLPVWYSLFSGNIQDMSTLMDEIDDVETSVGVSIDDLVLDAGYITKELITAYNADDRFVSFTGRMPARKGFPFRTLYHRCGGSIHQAKYFFDRNGHTYFGRRFEDVLFGKRVYLYVYIDRDRALSLGRSYRQNNRDEYEAMSDKEKNWLEVKNGYFVLVSNIDSTPAETLERYFGRMDIESFFKTSKEYLSLLPLSKWTRETIEGKLLNDIISTIVYLKMRKALSGTGLSMSKLFGRASSLMCTRKKDGTVIVEEANRQVKEIFKAAGIKIPSSMNLEEFEENYLLKPRKEKQK